MQHLFLRVHSEHTERKKKNEGGKHFVASVLICWEVEIQNKPNAM
jgi:hypothetical protein